MMKILSILVAVLLSSSLINCSILYSIDTHKVIGDIAQNYLDQNALSNLKYYLSEFQGSLAAVSIWADQIRGETRWRFTAPFHYINLDANCNLNIARDCPNDICVIGAIKNYTRQIKPKAQKFSYFENIPLNALKRFDSFSSIRDAIRFIVHFIGDIHQPLHVGKATDRGGNDISLRFYGKSANLHSVWDFDIPLKLVKEKYSGSFKNWTNSLIREIDNGKYKNLSQEWLKCRNGGIYGNSALCPEEWTVAMGRIACDVAYNGAFSGANLGDAYYVRTTESLELIVAQGGYRLAKILNNAFMNHKFDIVKK